MLQILRGEEDLRELLDDDDDDDEDFTLDWDELMGPDPFGEGALLALLMSHISRSLTCAKGCSCFLSIGSVPSASSGAMLLVSEVPRPSSVAPGKYNGIAVPQPCNPDVCMQHTPILSTILHWNADEGKPLPPPRRSERQRKYVYKNKNERPGHRERPVQATARLQSK
jgi:hypothetical protein